METKFSKLQCMDYLNAIWLKDTTLQKFYTRDGVQELFNKLLDNKEITYAPNSNCQDNQNLLFDFEKGYPTLEEQQHYNDKLLENQVLKLFNTFYSYKRVALNFTIYLIIIHINSFLCLKQGIKN